MKVRSVLSAVIVAGCVIAPSTFAGATDSTSTSTVPAPQPTSSTSGSDSYVPPVWINNLPQPTILETNRKLGGASGNATTAATTYKVYGYCDLPSSSSTNSCHAQGVATLTGAGTILAVIPNDAGSANTGNITQTAYFTGQDWVQTANGTLVNITHTDQLTCTAASFSVSVSTGGSQIGAGIKSATGTRTTSVTGQWNHVWQYNGSGRWSCTATAYLPAKATRRTSGSLSTKTVTSTVATSYEWWWCC